MRALSTDPPNTSLWRSLSQGERLLRLFSDVRPGEGTAGLLLLFNIFLVLMAYYLIKPVREGWLSISAIKDLSKMEVKAYSSFAQSIVLLGVVPCYAFLASRLSRKALITAVTLFFSINLVIFWLLQPGLIAQHIPYVGVAFYLWVGIFSVTVVAQFWSFAADLYTDERGKRLLPLIAVGASAGAAFGSWFTGQFIRHSVRETFDLILVSILPLLMALVLTWFVDRRGTTAAQNVSQSGPRRGPAAPDRSAGAFQLIFTHKYLFAVACLGLLINWVNTNGENILYGAVQESLRNEYLEQGLTDPTAVARFVKDRTTAFYGDLYFWVNLCGLLAQAFLVSRLLRFGGFALILFLTPLVSLLSYTLMAVFPVILVIRLMKIAENASNYSVNNTARHVIWLPLPPTMIYKAKTAVDTLFARMGDGMAALSMLSVAQIFQLPLKHFILFNVLLVLLWGMVAGIIVLENRRLLKTASSVRNNPASNPKGLQE